jgi:hypothetical protein
VENRIKCELEPFKAVLLNMYLCHNLDVFH